MDFAWAISHHASGEELDSHTVIGVRMADRLLSIHNVQGKQGAVVTVTSEILARDKTVYFHVVNKPLRYPFGRSRIVYIGTTKKGIGRIMGSIAERLDDEFNIHGVHTVEVHEIGCTPRQRVQTWRILERASLIAFRQAYGEVPWLNSHGERMKESDEFEYFNRAQIDKFIRLWES